MEEFFVQELKHNKADEERRSSEISVQQIGFSIRNVHKIYSNTKYYFLKSKLKSEKWSISMVQ